ncbi:MAG: type II secretion system F family protein [Micrococcales bacterium]|nr:type II secretion system F family protein [Micrococcales bacterium]
MATLDPLIQSLEEAAAIARSGATSEAVWAGLDGAIQEPWSRAVDSIRLLSQEVGVEAADLLDALARSAASEQEAADAREAALSGPRATARVLAWLPVLGLGIGCAIGARPWEVALDRGLGSMIVLVGVGLMMAGRAWTNVLLRRASAADHDAMSSLLTLELVAAALGAGLPIAAALTEVGRLGSGPLATHLAEVGARLAQGDPWDHAWSASSVCPRPSVFSPSPARTRRPAPTTAHDDDLSFAVRRALGLAWESGVAAGPLLQGAAVRERRTARRRANVAAGQLGVRLMLPLGLCFLPAFVALGLVPVVMSLASGLF